MNPVRQYTITKVSDLLAHILTIAEHLPIQGDASRGKARLTEALDRLKNSIRHEDNAAAITIVASHFMGDSEVNFTVHPHKDLGEAIQHAHDVTNHSPRIHDRDHLTLICTFALSGDSSRGVIPESAIGLIRIVPQLIGDSWDTMRIQAILHNAVTRLRNAEDAGHLFVVLGSRITPQSVEFAKQHFCSSESEAENYVKHLKSAGYVAAYLSTLTQPANKE